MSLCLSNHPFIQLSWHAPHSSRYKRKTRTTNGNINRCYYISGHSFYLHDFLHAFTRGVHDSHALLLCTLRPHDWWLQMQITTFIEPAIFPSKLSLESETPKDMLNTSMTCWYVQDITHQVGCRDFRSKNRERGKPSTQTLMGNSWLWKHHHHII